MEVKSSTLHYANLRELIITRQQYSNCHITLDVLCKPNTSTSSTSAQPRRTLHNHFHLSLRAFTRKILKRIFSILLLLHLLTKSINCNLFLTSLLYRKIHNIYIWITHNITTYGKYQTSRTMDFQSNTHGFPPHSPLLQGSTA